MKQTAKSDRFPAAHAQKGGDALARSPRPQGLVADGGRLAQLAAMINGSSRVQRLSQLAHDAQRSPEVQKPIRPAPDINHGAAAQLSAVPVNDDAGPEREADVMGAKAMTVQRQRMVDNEDRQVATSTVLSQGTPETPVQRVRILLKNEDPELMARVRLVPVANVGAQTLQDPGQVGTLNEIGMNESIVLEGHGYIETSFWSGERRAVSQGGVPPARLAALVNQVPKPDGWTGNVVLLGCSTGDITQAVSEEYFKLTEKTVKVIGTRASIRVGTKEDGSIFAGHDWSEQPLSQRPADLAYVEDLRAANKLFSKALKQLIAVSKAIALTISGKTTPIPHSLDGVETRGLYIVNVDNLSTHKGTVVEGRRYALPARERLADLFSDVFTEIRKLSFFDFPSTMKPIGDKATASKEFDPAVMAVKALVDAGDPLREAIEHELLGYTLKEIDLSSNVSAKHSKRRRTKTSIFGDTWVDEA